MLGGGLRISAAVFIEENVNEKQKADFSGNRAAVHGAFFHAAGDDGVGVGGSGGFWKVGHKDDLCAPLFCVFQHIKYIPGGAGEGKQQYHVLRPGQGDGHGLHMGVGNLAELVGDGGKPADGLHGNDHAAAEAQTVDAAGFLQGIHSLVDGSWVQAGQGIGQSRGVDGIELFAHVSDAVLHGHIAIQPQGHIQGPLAVPLYESQLEVVVAGETQSPAQPIHRGVSHAAVFRQGGNGHVLGFFSIGQNIVRYSLGLLCQLIIFADDQVADALLSHGNVLPLILLRQI